MALTTGAREEEYMTSPGRMSTTSVPRQRRRTKDGDQKVLPLLSTLQLEGCA
jgi:hypothetical protein